MVIDDVTFRLLLERDYIIFPINPNGNCFFTSIAYHLGRGLSHRAQFSVRREIQEFMRDRWAEYQDFFPDENEYNQMVRQTTVDRTFNADFGPLAAALRYDVNVITISPGVTELSPFVAPADQMFANRVYLSYHNGNHYNYLIPKDCDMARRQTERCFNIPNSIRKAGERANPKRGNGGTNENEKSKRAKTDQNVAGAGTKEPQCPENVASNTRVTRSSQKNPGFGNVASNRGVKRGGQKNSGPDKEKAKTVQNVVSNRGVKRGGSKNHGPKNVASHTAWNLTDRGVSTNNATNSGSKDVASNSEGNPTDRGASTNSVRATAQKSASGGVSHLCPYCRKEFKSVFAMDTHVEKFHGEDRPFHCSKCGRSYATQENLRVHGFRYHNNRTYKCTIGDCTKEFSNGPSLLEHKKRYHQTKFECKKCGETFSSYNELQNHFKKHRKGVFPCTICPGKSFSLERDLAKHMRFVHEGEYYECEVCKSAIKGYHEYLKHKENVHPTVPHQYQCLHCEKRFSSRQYLTKHVLRVHTMGEFVCPEPECFKKFTSAHNLRSHISSVHANGHFPCDEAGCSAVFKNYHRLYGHKHTVHVAKLHVCNYCGASTKTKSALKHHQDTVHTMVRDYVCTINECGATFKSCGTLVKHQRFVHWDERLHECDVCGVTFHTNRDLCKHNKYIHFIDDGTESKEGKFECKLCTPPLNLYNNASWVFHRLLHHIRNLAEGDPKTFDEIYTSSRNKILVAGDTEINSYIEQAQKECKTCEIKFYSNDCFRNHVSIHHTVGTIKPLDLVDARIACRFVETADQNTEACEKLYHLSSQIFPTVDRQRKVYDLLIVPAQVTETELKRYISKKDSTFYMYCGSRSYALERDRSVVVTPHHTATNQRAVSTNLLMKILDEGPIKYKAWIINEKYIDQAEPSGCCLQHIKKLEALDIFTMFLFAKRYEREDVIFQRLEEEQMRNFTKQEITNVIKEVENSQGFITNLSRFNVNMSKPIVISTSHVKEQDCQFSTCRKCRHGCSPVLVSQFHATKHDLSHNKNPTKPTLTERFLLMPASLNPDEVFDLLQETVDDEIGFWVYFVVGSDEPISSLEQALNTATEGYVGQSTGNPVSDYHFLKTRSSSGLKKLRDKYTYVYLISNWKFQTARDMRRAETALIVQGSLLFGRTAGGQGIALINEFCELYSISNLFEMSEWKRLFNKQKGFMAVLPEFLTKGKRTNPILDITYRIPKTTQRNPPNEDYQETDYEDD